MAGSTVAFGLPKRIYTKSVQSKNIDIPIFGEIPIQPYLYHPIFPLRPPFTDDFDGR